MSLIHESSGMVTISIILPEILKSNMAWVPSLICKKSVFLQLWDNHELYGRKILYIESFSAKKSENLVRNFSYERSTHVQPPKMIN